jgi:hypothetical protein
LGTGSFANASVGLVSSSRGAPENDLRSAPKHGVSVVVPVAERPGPLARIYREHVEVLESAGYRPEFIFAVEPAFRDKVADLEILRAEGHPIRIVQPGQAMGESALLKAGAARAGFPVVLTLPPYWRVDPAEIPKLLEHLEADEVDLVLARRWPRRDSWLNRLQNRAYHFLLQPTSGEAVHDVACGVRAMRRDLLLELPLFGDFHRFLPLIARREGYQVAEIPMAQHPEDQGARVYSPGVYVHRVIDILGIQFLLRFTEKPLRFFGLLGSAFSLLGAVILAVMAIERIQGQAIADRPLLLLGTLLLVLGVQAIALGLVGEIIVHLSAPARRPYRLLRKSEESTERSVQPSDSTQVPEDAGRPLHHRERQDVVGRG